MKSSRKITTLFLTLFVLVFTLTALFACGENLYTVTFDSNGGSSVSSATVAEGEQLAAPAIPVKEDYVFMGWQYVDGMWNFENPISSDMTLVAIREKSAEADSVTVTFDSVGGSAIADITVGKGATVGAPEAPERAGYVFIGWTYGGADFNFSTALSKDITLRAKWNTVDYTIAYELGGGTAENPLKYTVVSDTIVLEAPEKAGYDFLGWTFEGQSEPQKEIKIEKGSVGDKSFTANWAVTKYAITYDYDGGTGAEEPVTEYTSASESISIPDPQKANYSFLGWTFEGQTEPQKGLVIESGSTGDYALKANWSAVEYTISYILGDGGDINGNPETYTHESEFTLANPIRPGYMFTGWTFQGQETPTKSVSVPLGTTGNKTYTANWELVRYSISYEFKGGAPSSGETLPLTFTVNDLPLTLPSVYLVDGGSAFTSWYTDEELENPISQITDCKSIKLYAGFSAITEGLQFTSVPGGVHVSGYTGESPVVYIPDIYNGKIVTGIAANAFQSSAVTDVYIPYAAREIGTNAFYACTALKNVVFKQDGALETIGDRAFSACISIESIVIPENVKSLGSNVFASCTSLTDVSFAKESKLEVLGASAFESCSLLKSVTLPKGVSELKPKTFYLCASLDDVTLCDALTSIGSEAFLGCTALSEISIPANVTAIGDSAFNNATVLSNIEFKAGSKLESIGKSAFYGCDALVSVSVPGTVKTIGDNAFAYSDKLETVSFGENSVLASIGAYAFYDCESLKGISLPDSLKTVGDYAFYYCTKIEAVSFGTSLEAIGRAAFYNCNLLTEVKLPASVKEIKKDAFKGCTKIVTLEISAIDGIISAFGGSLPATIETVVVKGNGNIEKGAFAGCTALKSLTISSFGVEIKPVEKPKDGEPTEETVYGTLIELFGAEIPASLKTVAITGSNPLAENTFDGAENVKNIIISSETEIIYNMAFSGATSLETLELGLRKTLAELFGEVPSTLHTVTLLKTENITVSEDENAPKENAIVQGAFAETDVKTVIIAKEITEIGDSAFKGCQYLTSVVIPEGSKLSKVGSNAFEGCSLLSTVGFTSKTLDFGDAAFKDSAITSVTFAEGTTLTLGTSVFENCAKLEGFDTVAVGMTIIPANTFKNCTALASIKLSDNITSIGDNAFESCTALAEFTIGADSLLAEIGSAAFKGSAIKSIIIPAAVAKINASAFENCANLKAVTFVENSVLEEISGNAFANSAIEAIFLPPSLKTIQEGAFLNASKLSRISFGIGSLLTRIDAGAFENCVSITEIEIPDGVSTISNNAFKNCKGLTKVSFGEGSSLSSILGHAFESCIKLTAFAVPKSVVTIGEYAFAQCHSLANISFSENSMLSEISAHAFYNCASLETVTLPKGTITLGSYAFASCSNLKEFIFSEGCTVEAIPEFAFSGDAKLATLVIPESVKTVGESAFRGCAALITVEDGVSYVGKWLVDCVLDKVTVAVKAGTVGIANSAFRNCSMLTSVAIPESVKYIGSNAFVGCASLDNVTLFVGTKLIGDSIFEGCTVLSKVEINYSSSKNETESIPEGWSTSWCLGKEDKITFKNLTPPAA